MRRMQFGRSSDQMNEMLGQLELSLEELETLRAEAPADKLQRPAPFRCYFGGMRLRTAPRSPVATI